MRFIRLAVLALLAMSCAQIAAAQQAFPVGPGVQYVPQSSAPTKRTTNGSTWLNSADGTLRFTNPAGTTSTIGGGAGGYVTIGDEGSSLTARGVLNFTGAGVTCADNSGASRTDCTIAGGGGGGTFATTYSSTATDNRISLNSTGGALSIRDNATPISDYLFKVGDSVGNLFLAMSPQGLELHNKGVTSGVIYKVLNVDTSSVVNTGLSAGGDPTEVLFRLSHTVQFASGAVTAARAFVVEPPTYSSAAANTLSDAATVAILAAPTAGTNMTITRKHALWVQAGLATFAGGLNSTADTTFGTNFKWDYTNSRLLLGAPGTTPTGTLHMSGGSGSAAQMRIDNTFSSVYMMCGSADSAAVAFCGSLSSHPFALRYANSNKVYLNSADLSPASDGGVDYGNQTQHIGSVIAYRLMNVVSTQSFSATPSFDFSTSGASKRMVLTGNVTSSTFTGCSSATDGMLVHLELVQDATGSRTWAGIPTGAKVAGSSMTLSTGANKVDMFTFECHSADSNTYVEVARSMNQ